MKVIDTQLLDELSASAKQSARLRKNHNFHTQLSDPINRMLNAFEPGSYVQPHKHEFPDKREVFLVLRGSLVLFYFDEAGVVTNSVLIDRNAGCYGVEVEPRRWHTVASLEPGTVVYEIKDGPYDAATDKIMAPWAPAEGDPGCSDYLKVLLKAAGMQ